MGSSIESTTTDSTRDSTSTQVTTTEYLLNSSNCFYSYLEYPICETFVTDFYIV